MTTHRKQEEMKTENCFREETKPFVEQDMATTVSPNAANFTGTDWRLTETLMVDCKRNQVMRLL